MEPPNQIKKEEPKAGTSGLLDQPSDPLYARTLEQKRSGFYADPITRNNFVMSTSEFSAERTQWASLEDAMELSGTGRSRLYQLLNEHPEVKTLNLKRPGRTKGRRLVHIPSLLGFLEKLASEQAVGKAVTA